LNELKNDSLCDEQPIDVVGRYKGCIPANVHKVALSYERNELWKRNKDITLVLLRTFGTKYQSDILEHASSFVYTTLHDVKARDVEKRDARYCCECKGWYVGVCVCLNYGGYLPGNPENKVPGITGEKL
jgi:hypothetical protein